MKRTLITVLVAMAVLAGGYGAGWAYDSPIQPPHTDFTPRYETASCGGVNAGACHEYSKGTFLPEALDRSAGAEKKDWTDFCLSCHNTSGEAHERSVGSPSTNSYSLSNHTTLTPGTYSGNAHSWNGVIGNAGTGFPNNSGFEGTKHMINNNRVNCQVCHQGMSKRREQNLDWETTSTTDQLNYTIDGYSSTKQYLAKYLRVYRTTTFTSRPNNSRTKKDNLVDPSEYVYINASAIVRFSTSQSVTDYIYADIGQPYLRAGNESNAACLDCHTDRTSSSVAHEPGTGAKDSHPAVTSYGHSNGLNDTLKSSADSNIYIEGGQVLCTSCHDPHNSASDDGQLTRSAASSELCTDCHKANGFDGYTTAILMNHSGAKHSSATECLDCHTTHNSNNIMLIRNEINGKTVNFRNFSGAQSFGNDSGSSVCEACHTTTNYHKSDGTGTGHHAGDRCTKCHPHANGFQAGGCSACHGFPPPPAPNNVSPSWNDTTGDAHLSHKSHLEAAPFNLSGALLCNECHGNGNDRRGDHNTNKNSAGIDTTTWTNWTGVGGDWGSVFFSYSTTIGKDNTSDDACTNVSCHSASGTRVWGGGTDCNSCHSYPTAGSNWTASGHTVQYDGVAATHLPTAAMFNYSSDTYVAVTTDPARCGKCHYNSLGTDANHRNNTVNLAAGGGLAACGGGEFTIHTTLGVVTCSNVKCHTAGKTTPGWN